MADPYVIASIADQQKRSRTVSSTLNPTWEESLVFSGQLGTFLQHSLQLAVYDQDFGRRDDHLGTVQVRIGELAQRDSLEFVESLPTQGSLTFEVTWSAVDARQMQRGVMVVTLERAAGLKAADRNGYSDPYCKLTLCGQKHKSATIKRTVNPRWAQDFNFNGELHDLCDEPLQLQVFDYDFGPQRDDFLGDAAVDLRSLRTQSSGSFEVPLSIQGHVYLKVKWLPGPT